MSTYHCSFCNKKYNRITFYKRHELCCEMKTLNNRNDKIEYNPFTKSEMTEIY